MTNTKFRKRALLSSVAMLLVALVAIGSATFAWFTAEPSVSASGIQAFGVTSTGLEIKTDTNPTYGDTATFLTAAALADGASLKIKPAYVISASSMFETTSGDQNSADPVVDESEWASVTPNNESASYNPSTAETKLALTSPCVYSEKAYIKTTDGASKAVYLTSVTMTPGSTTSAIKNGVTVAIAKSDGTIIARYKLGTNVMKAYATAEGATANVPTDGAKVKAPDATNTTITAKGSAPSNALLGTATSTPVEVTVLVYLDGTDQDVKTKLAVAEELLSTITVNFSTKNPNA